MAYSFDVEKVTNQCIQWIKEWFASNGNDDTKAVIGISGGKDSALTGKLLVEALGKDRVVGVMLPNIVQQDLQDSQMVCKALGIKSLTVNIGNSYSGLTEVLKTVLPDDEYSYANYKTNTPARIRMATLFGISAIIGNSFVANTCNLSEDVMGYSTFYGDSAGCFSPLCKLTTDEVIAMGDFLGMPKEIMHKAPSDGMCGKTDEDNLGWTYHEVNEYIRENKKGPHYNQIVERWKRNKYKVDIIQLPSFDPLLPDFSRT